MKCIYVMLCIYNYTYIFILVNILNKKLYILIIMKYHHSCDSYDRDIFIIYTAETFKLIMFHQKNAQGVFLPRLYIPSSLVRPGTCSN